MTIQTSVHKARFIGDGVNTTFPFAFKTFQTTDLQLTQTSLAGTDAPVISLFSIALNVDQENSPGGTITYPTSGAPLAAGVVFTVTGVLAETQLTDLTNAGGFFPKTISDRFDYITILIQQHAEKLARALLGSVSDAAPGLSLGTAAQRALKYLTFDVSGNVSLAQALPSGTLSQTSIGSFLYPQVAAEVTAGVAPTFFFYPVGNVLRYGAVGDGVTNNYTAFQKGLAVCKVLGKRLFVPAGNYVIDTASGTLVLSYVKIEGEGALEGTATPGAAGSVLSIKSTTNTPFQMRAGVVLDGLGIYYPAQVDSATPIVFPPTINVDASAGAVNFCYIQNCTVFNAYRFFVDTDAAGSIGHIYIDNNSIYGILTCYEIAYNAEIIHWTDNDHTFGLFVSATEGGLRGYTRANGTCLQMTRTDGFTFTGNLMFGYLNGINFATSGNLCQLMNIVGNVWDNVRFGIVASGTGNLTGMSVSGNSFGCLNGQNTALLGTCILVSTSGALAAETWDIGPNYFGSTTGDLIKVSGTPTRALNFSGGIYTSWAAFSATGLFAAFNISGGATAFNISGAYLLNQSGSTQAAGILGTCSVMNLSGVVFGQCVGAIGLVGTPSGYNFTCVTGCTSYGTSGTFANNYFATTFSDVGNSWDKNSLKSPNVVPIAQYGNFANDAAAAAGGVPVGGQYRNASVVQVRVT